MASVDPLLLLVLLLQSAMPSAQNLVVLAQVGNVALFLLVVRFKQRHLMKMSCFALVIGIMFIGLVGGKWRRRGSKRAG